MMGVTNPRRDNARDDRQPHEPQTAGLDWEDEDDQFKQANSLCKRFPQLQPWQLVVTSNRGGCCLGGYYYLSPEPPFF
jgi:hypothetical protein